MMLHTWKVLDGCIEQITDEIVNTVPEPATLKDLVNACHVLINAKQHAMINDSRHITPYKPIAPETKK